MTCLSRAQQRLARTRILIPLTLSFILVACNGGGGGTGTTGGTAANLGAVTDATALSDGINWTDGSDSTTQGAPVASNPTVDTAAVVARLTNVGKAGRTYYVATNGNDGNNGLSLDTPFRSPEAAMRIVNPGDAIEIRGGTYRPTAEDAFRLRRGGTPDAWIKMKAYNGEKVILSGGPEFVIYGMDYAPYWILEGLELSGGGVYTLKLDNHHVNVVNNNIHGSSNDIVKLVQTSNDMVIYGNEIHHNNAAPGANAQGVDIVGSDRVWVAHNWVHDTASIAIYAKGNSRNILFENNRVENIPSRGLMLGQSTDSWLLEDGNYETYDSIIRNNVVINTTDACLASASSMNVKIYNNSCYNVATASHGAIYLSNESMVGQASTNVEVKNNIVVSAGRPVLKVNGDAMTDWNTLHLENNVFWSTGGPVNVLWLDNTLPFETWKAAALNTAGTVAADPKYTSFTSLMIAADSPAVNSGVAVSVPGTPFNSYANVGASDDYRHAARPQGGAADIGAYEVN